MRHRGLRCPGVLAARHAPAGAGTLGAVGQRQHQRHLCRRAAGGPDRDHGGMPGPARPRLGRAAPELHRQRGPAPDRGQAGGRGRHGRLAPAGLRRGRRRSLRRGSSTACRRIARRAARRERRPAGRRRRRAARGPVRGPLAGAAGRAVRELRHPERQRHAARLLPPVRSHLRGRDPDEEVAARRRLGSRVARPGGGRRGAVRQARRGDQLFRPAGQLPRRRHLGDRRRRALRAGPPRDAALVRAVASADAA